MIYHVPVLLQNYETMKIFTGQGKITTVIRAAYQYYSNTCDESFFFFNNHCWLLLLLKHKITFPKNLLSLMSGVEKKNDDFRRYFHRKINKWDTCKSLLTVEKREEVLEPWKQTARHPCCIIKLSFMSCCYQCPNKRATFLPTTSWESYFQHCDKSTCWHSTTPLQLNYASSKNRAFQVLCFDQINNQTLKNECSAPGKAKLLKIPNKLSLKQQAYKARELFSSWKLFVDEFTELGLFRQLKTSSGNKAIVGKEEVSQFFEQILGVKEKWKLDVDRLIQL